MSSILHITNGDSFTNRLRSLPIKGEIITWREMLCEGKTLNNVGSENFWKTRFDFLSKNYKVSKSKFIERTLKEYRSLCNHKQQDQIVLWFEYDLFCQINMLAVVSWLKMHRRYAEISIVCSGKVEGQQKMFGLNELTEDQLLNLYENKTSLRQDDIEYADYIWQLYCSDNPIRLENLTDFDKYRFPYLKQAIGAHIKRFPSIKNGLNVVENNLLHVANSQKPKTKSQLVEKVLADDNTYGFGDIQYEKIITSLKPLFGSFNPVRLTKKGKEILDQQTSYYSCIQDNDVYLGGALKYNYLYNGSTNRILKL
ncbi:DUF1835 domain-containing protein [Cellulophaga sp. F20128]|uniref:DUF1835 domain-containing protein n=1 Tax=Cellulophaga sp. F20128 TaxID=2926413 RepID=UPI001FF4AC36|nr:DUF1835 domain-containing protein [Cellulophaga sp. F20128]MCK0158207.1 DUF1835 domain-containing protein [Cellulophaga sp. F20128]